MGEINIHNDFKCYQSPHVKFMEYLCNCSFNAELKPKSNQKARHQLEDINENNTTNVQDYHLSKNQMTRALGELLAARNPPATERAAFSQSHSERMMLSQIRSSEKKLSGQWEHLIPD